MWSYAKLTFWAFAWIVLWIVFLPFRRGRDNCLTWAIDKWDNDGGYLVIRWCRTSKYKWFTWPHFMWISDEVGQKYVQHLIPPPDHCRMRAVPCPWFDGEVVTGDKNAHEN